METKELKKGIQEPVVISKLTTDLLLKTENPSDNMGLYWFYYQTAKWKNKFVIDASTTYVMKGLRWSEMRVFKAKKVLLNLGLIKNVQKRNKGTFVKHLIHINVIGCDWKTTTQENAVLAETSTNINSTNSLNINSTNSLNNYYCARERTIRKRRIETVPNNEQVLLAKIKELENQLKLLQPIKAPLPIVETNQLSLFPKEELITEKHFDQFWQLYPCKAAKGTAHTAWRKLCTQKNKQSIRPTWKVVQTALKGHIKSEQWEDPNFRIPNASTWLNDERWLNDPKEMKKLTFNNNSNKPKNGKIYTGVMGNKVVYETDLVM